MDSYVLYAVHRYFSTLSPEAVTGWIERPHLLQPHLVGISDGPRVIDQQTNGDPLPLHLAMWILLQPHLHGWTVQPDPDRRLWLLTTWSDAPGAQHRLSVIAVGDEFARILHAWPGAAAAVPIGCEWLTDEVRSVLTLAAAAS